MEENNVFEGKTTTEAIEKGLKELKIKKEDAEITVLKEEKRNFFSILEPRVVKVKIEKKLKNDANTSKVRENHNKTIRNKASEETIKNVKEKIDKFLKDFLKQFGCQDVSYKISNDNEFILVEILGENTNNLIGYRGETLNAIQTILSAIANKNNEEKIKIVLDISGYKEKRKKILEELADKVSKTVIKTGKKVVLEPMQAYERKIIHVRLQDNKNVTTESIGESPYRKVVIDIKRK